MPMASRRTRWLRHRWRSRSLSPTHSLCRRGASMTRPSPRTSSRRSFHWYTSPRPVLYKIAMDYLSIPTTAVPSERANSAAKRVFEGRDSLGDNMFKAQMCAKSWMQLAKALDFPLPDDYLQALDDLKARVDLLEMAKEDPVIQYYLDCDLKSE
ncbi:hypothetical protein SDRG_08940 [Saprolegnia diclina VS20]|uniref:HAT C-terminal dimerisation domain-containing protein n=1 Tax=Saprolegnia diclina (strain VS20) TaxID=1156394 RepID=T0QI76_SAPDV|nr:hypothetical protein SDRG_08940 [Saprolegnia diclina VS20]EQC33425.1 hypothetical protein SDRG_08940 [Saprolegnia diclina VS20]|eukprot:XP_008613065.1 hypothetical protein SDRG_08940 [Saprolegnia diclina VS20]